MQNPKAYTVNFQNKPKSKPKVVTLFVTIIVGLSLSVFAASIWFSSYAKGVYLQRRPIFENKQEKIQNEIHKLELEENALTDVKRIRSLIKELGLVEPTRKSIELRNR